MTDQRRVVHRHLRRANLFERRGDVDGRSAAVAGDDRCHAHADEVFGERPIRHFVRVRVHVDEAGRDRQSLDIERFHALDRRNLADLRDPAVADENVARERLRAGTIDDARVLDQDRVGGIRRRNGLRAEPDDDARKESGPDGTHDGRNCITLTRYGSRQ